MVARVPLSRYAVPDVYDLAARHLQLMRSVPSKSVLGTVVGMKSPEHVKSNLEIIKKPAMTIQEFADSVKPVLRSEFIEDSLEM